MATHSTSVSAKPRDYFATTHWSLVLTAARNDTTRAQAALDELCRSYWYPLYGYVRRCGWSPHDAQDLTQSFFACLLERESLLNATPERGRFRSFLLGAMKHFLAHEWARLRAQKRGGGAQVVSLDFTGAEERFDLELTADSPDAMFDREWANALLEKVLCQLEDEFRGDGKADVFDVLKQTLAGSRENQAYDALAVKLGTSEGAVKTAVHRLRKRYRELLQREIASTVASPEQVKEEMNYLFTVVAKG